MTGRTNAVLGAALLCATALVQVPTELYQSSVQDFTGSARDVLFTLLAGGLLVFGVLILLLLALPRRWGAEASMLVTGLALYAWLRSGFFPGPSLSLDGGRVTADLSTGVAGLLVPVAGAFFVAWLARGQPRAVTALLAVLLGGSIVQSTRAAVYASQARPGASDNGVGPFLEWSRQGNVLILVLDALQSDVFEDVLDTEPGLRAELDGFSYYRRASSSSPTTYLSVPTIHSGRHYQPGTPVRQFYRDGITEGSVLNRLANAGYQVSYAVGVGPCPRAVTSCLGTAELSRSRSELALKDAAHLMDLGVYRVLPDVLRAVFLRGDRGPLTSVVGRPYLVDRAVGEAAALQRLASGAAVTDGPPTAKMIHSMITHRPAVLQPDCSLGPVRDHRVGMTLQVRCALKRVGSLLGSLKALGVYDVTAILMVADHGYGFESRFAAASQDERFRRMVGAFNPIVLAKPPGTHGPLATSDAPVELADLAGALCGVTGCSPATGLPQLGEVDPGRTRPAFRYDWKQTYWDLERIPGLVRYSITGDLTRVESWTREASEYTPGTTIDFRRGGNSGHYLGFGWGRRESTQILMADARATLWMRVAFESARDYELVVDGQVTAAPAAVEGRVTVEVNGIEVGELNSSEPRGRFETYRLAVSRGLLSRSPQTTVRFSVSEPGGAFRLEPAGVGFAVRTVELRPLLP